ncbi:NhaP-type Na+/H+ or K+/H+ antiporter [Lipingzhangella halophila]|uniref:NhaP-type Na+/H+ or K+/H+ antiporter n=1 Tax=Lipingzhangella halophila TaxID=1783352 RepID=A0A7W7RDG2_9ACTN|nr:hypothetical protein [Lipingzhangella halophila]MBB4929972.1 NhaP-type Na+/H+ or K+/H+ antiporter [Lipingzhangella halophila]
MSTLGLVRLPGPQRSQPERTLDADTLFDLLRILFGCASGLGAVIGLFVAYLRQRTMDHEAQRENIRLAAVALLWRGARPPRADGAASE